MLDLQAIDDYDLCRSLWARHVPTERLADLWSVRDAFNREFKRPPLFITASESTHGPQSENRLRGLLPLSWIEEEGYYAFFPGETWHGKTWLEQNRFLADCPETFEAILAYLDNLKLPYNLRFLLPPGNDIASPRVEPDEINYHCKLTCFEDWFRRFSGKSAKKLTKHIELFDAEGLEVRKNHKPDFFALIDMNIEKFGEHSYFSDERFKNSFINLFDMLEKNGWAQLTTILIHGKIAAIDFGAIHNSTYTLLGGGVNPEFTGVAKYINHYHIRRAASENISEVDFLCENFSWKELFHLDKKTLYKITGGGFTDPEKKYIDPNQDKFDDSSQNPST